MNSYLLGPLLFAIVFISIVSDSIAQPLSLSSKNCPLASDLLPPNPGESGKATLAGIDSDGDGVRDDIQRFIVLIAYPNSARARMALRQFAKAMQVVLLAPHDRNSQRYAAEQANRAQDCLWYLYNEDSDRMWEELLAEYLNTRVRRLAYIHSDDKLGGEVFTLTRDSELKAQCECDPDSLPN